MAEFTDVHRSRDIIALSAALVTIGCDDRTGSRKLSHADANPPKSDIRNPKSVLLCYI